MPNIGYQHLQGVLTTCTTCSFEPLKQCLYSSDIWHKPLHTPALHGHFDKDQHTHLRCHLRGGGVVVMQDLDCDVAATHAASKHTTKAACAQHDTCRQATNTFPPLHSQRQSTAARFYCGLELGMQTYEKQEFLVQGLT